MEFFLIRQSYVRSTYIMFSNYSVCIKNGWWGRRNVELLVHVLKLVVSFILS